MDNLPEDATTQNTKTVLINAQKNAASRSLSQVTPLTILASLLEDMQAQAIIRSCGIDLKKLQEIVVSLLPKQRAQVSDLFPGFSAEASAIMDLAVDEAARLPHIGQLVIEPVHVLLGLTRLDDDQIADLLKSATITLERVRDIYKRMLFSNSNPT